MRKYGYWSNLITFKMCICWRAGINSHNLHPLLSKLLPSAYAQTSTHPLTHAHTEHNRGVLHAVGFPWPYAQQCVEAPPPPTLASGKVTDKHNGGGGGWWWWWWGGVEGVRHTGTPPLAPCDLKKKLWWSSERHSLNYAALFLLRRQVFTCTYAEAHVGYFECVCVCVCVCVCEKDRESTVNTPEYTVL